LRTAPLRPLSLPRPSLGALILAATAAVSGCNSCSKPEVAGSDAAPVATTVPDAAPINATTMPTASIAAMVNPQKLPAYAGPTGSVEGTITVTGDPAPETPADFKKCPDAEKTYGRAFREGEPKEPRGPRWLADAVVAVTGYESFFVQEKDEAEELIVQNCAFAKRTVTMTFGQRLEVKNLTREFWTPMLEPGPSSVMMMATPGGDAVKLYPKRPGHYHVVDHDRRYTATDLYAFLHPLHTSSAIAGTYRIDGVPVGKVKVNTSHPRIPGVDAVKEVEIKQGVVERVDLTLDHKAPPATDAGPKAADAGVYPPLH
jgi:hypothetical protein